MVVSTQELTSLSPLGTTFTGLKERTDASLVRTSSAEPLNAKSAFSQTKPCKHWRREIHPAVEQEEGNPISRVPVVDSEGTTLMPCTPAKARILIKEGKARSRWNKIGIFYIQLNYRQKPNNQIMAIGVDPGSKFEGFSVVGRKDTVLNVMSKAVDWVKKAVEQRRQMRRARRYRNTRRRPWRGDNRLTSDWRISPSTRARWNVKLRIIQQLKKILPLTDAVVEDVRAKTEMNQRKWNENFSPLEVGKQFFHTELKKLNLKLTKRTGVDTKSLREQLGLTKTNDRSRQVFESHCVDAWCLAASVSGAEHPSARDLYYVVPLRFHRRQLHRLEPEKGGERRPYGGTISLSLKRGSLVKHIKYGLCYLGGTLKGRFSLHSLKTGKRLTQNAKREEFRVLTRISFRSQFLQPINSLDFLKVI